VQATAQLTQLAHTRRTYIIVTPSFCTMATAGSSCHCPQLPSCSSSCGGASEPPAPALLVPAPALLVPAALAEAGGAAHCISTATPRHPLVLACSTAHAQVQRQLAAPSPCHQHQAPDTSQRVSPAAPALLHVPAASQQAGSASALGHVGNDTRQAHPHGCSTASPTCCLAGAH
jgi:hypothetical protein